MNNTLKKLVTSLYNNTTASHSTTASSRCIYQNLQRYVYGYSMMIICGAGILGNILAFAVLSRKSMRSSNSAMYLRCLAAIDACVLVLAVLRYRSYYVLLDEHDVINMVLNFDPYVQVYITPLFWVALGVSSFITLSLSFERYLAIKWPLTLKQRCTKAMVRICIVVIITVVFLVTFPHFLCYKLKKTQFGNTSVVAIQLINTYLDAQAYLHTYSYYVLPIMWYMVPWVIVTVLNILLSIQVQKTSSIRVGIPTLVNLNRNLSILIILIVGMYMVCHFPRCILAFYCLVNYCSASSMGEEIHTKSYYIVIAAADTLNILNSCLNIVVYCMTGSRFRQEVKRLLLCSSFCTQPAAQPSIQSLHVSLREVPATPMDDRKSFNMSYKDLRLANSNLPSPSQSIVDLQPSHTKISPNPSLKDCNNISHNSLLLTQNRTKRNLLSASFADHHLSVTPQPIEVIQANDAFNESSAGSSTSHPTTNALTVPNASPNLDNQLLSIAWQPVQMQDPPPGNAKTYIPDAESTSQRLSTPDSFRIRVIKPEIITAHTGFSGPEILINSLE